MSLYQVIKPTLGSASAHVTVIKSLADRDNFLASKFYTSLDSSGRRMDYTGDLMIESFVHGKMCHVNGYANRGIINPLENIWAFEYISTNLGFTEGNAYGNIFIPNNSRLPEPINSERFNSMMRATQIILDTLPCPEHLIFHLELFEKEIVTDDGSVPKQYEYTLCEIAARRPGGSIGSLINIIEGGTRLGHFNNSAYQPNPFLFSEMEFRLACGLNLRHNRRSKAAYFNTSPPHEYKHFSIGDLILPLRTGVLKYIPDPSQDRDKGKRTILDMYKVDMIQVAKVGRIYKGFDLNEMNTCVRFVCKEEGPDGDELDLGDIDEGLNSNDDMDDDMSKLSALPQPKTRLSIHERLHKVMEWYERTVIYEPLPRIKGDRLQSAAL